MEPPEYSERLAWVVCCTVGAIVGLSAVPLVLLLPTEYTRPARGLPGLRSFHIGIDRQAGTFCGVSVWDTAEQSQAMGALRAPLEALGAQFQAPETFEVVSQL
jgi:hypothetical protein